MPGTSLGREFLLTDDGSVGATFVRDLRDGVPLADLLETTLDHPRAVQFLGDRLPGWQVAAEPALGRALLEAGATPVRHAHTMVVRTDVADDSWRDADPGPGLRVIPVDIETLSPMALLESQRAAYPPEHPDHEDEIGMVGLLVLIMGGDVLGPLLPESGLVCRGDTVVAGLLLNDRPGEAPEGGAWVADVWRHPDHRGLGTVLLKRAIAGLRDRGVTHLSLTVTEGNPARARYDLLGFQHAIEALRIRLPAHGVTADASTAVSFYLENARLRAHTLLPVEAGIFGVRDPRFPESYEHNRLVSERARGAAELMDLAETVLADAPHREIEVLAPMDDADVAAMVDAGFEHESTVLMARPRDDADSGWAPDPRVRAAAEDEVAPFVMAQWYRDVPAYGEVTVRQLTERRMLLDEGSTAVRFAAEVDGSVVGSLDLVVRGPVAELDALGVHPEHRQGRLGEALMRAALLRAHELGVEVTILTALSEDWPRAWYRRLGFVEVRQTHEFTRLVTP